jgi:GMP synthase-like glutamine amidotransferase
MTLAVLQHETATGLGRLARSLDTSGVAYEVLPTLGRALPEPRLYDGVVALGGSLSARDVRLAAARDWIRDAALSDVPYLGICLGGQLLAGALGAQVLRSRREVGVHNVYLTDAAARDPLFGNLPRRLEVFGFHGESFALPQGATPLAGSVACTYQAFRYGAFAYALQFHPEVRPGDVVRWSDVPGYQNLVSAEGRGWAEIVAELEAVEPALDRLAATLLERWLAVAAGAAAFRTHAPVPA